MLKTLESGDDIMTQLYDHQKKIINEDKKKVGLFLGTGSGKTRTALHLAKGKTLVICPKTQKEDGNWERENETIGVDLTTISKETFRRDQELHDRYDTIIVDEAHTCLGVTPNTRQRKKQIIPRASQLYEALESFIERTKPERLYLCTATILRSPFTVWGAGKLLGKDWDFFQWREVFYARLPMPGREVWQARSNPETKERLAKAVKEIGYVGRLEDFFDVPDQSHHVDYIELTTAQKKRIKEMAIEYPEPIVRVGKIHSIENGVLAGDEFSKAEHFDNGKIDKLLDYALEFPRLVIFAKYTAQIEAIRLAMESKGYKVLTLTGATKDRGQVILEANNSKECVFIAQAQVSSGWELPDFPTMIFASRTYSFVDYDQALGRIQRANNIKKNLYIYLVARGGTDEAVHKSLLNKQDFNEHLYATGI